MYLSTSNIRKWRKVSEGDGPQIPRDPAAYEIEGILRLHHSTNYYDDLH